MGRFEILTEEILPIPATLEEAIERLKKSKGVKEWAKMKEDSAVGASHHGMGAWIRNEWGLWKGSPLSEHFNTMGIFHPDDMSGIIMTSLHRALNNKPLNIEGQVKYYTDYWKAMGRKNDGTVQ